MSQVPRGPVNRQSSMSRSAVASTISVISASVSIQTPLPWLIRWIGTSSREDSLRTTPSASGPSTEGTSVRQRAAAGEGVRGGVGGIEGGRAQAERGERLLAGAAGCGGGGVGHKLSFSRRWRSQSGVRYFGRGSRLWCARLLGVRRYGVVRCPVPAYGSGVCHGRSRTFPTFGSPDPTNSMACGNSSSGSSCVTSGSGSSSPAPKTRTVCAQASGARTEHGVHLQLPHDEIRRVEPVRARRRDPGQDQPPAAPQQGGGGARGGRGPGGLDDDVEVVRQLLVLGAEVRGTELLRQLRPVRTGRPRRAARPASPPSGTGRRTCPSVPVPTTATRSPGHGVRLERGGRDARGRLQQRRRRADPRRRPERAAAGRAASAWSAIAPGSVNPVSSYPAVHSVVSPAWQRSQHLAVAEALADDLAADERRGHPGAHRRRPSRTTRGPGVRG